MSAEILDWDDVEQGSTFQWEIYLLDTDGVTPLDLTGCTVRSQLRKSYSDTNPTLSFTCTINPVPTTGRVIISATATQTAAVPKGKYVYDVEVEDTVGKVFKPYKGCMCVTPEATKS